MVYGIPPTEIVMIQDDDLALCTTVEDEETLRSRYASPRFLPVLDQLDRSCRLFIAHSPIVIIASTQPGNGIDISPRGDAPGFVHVLDEHTLVIPDHQGNNSDTKAESDRWQLQQYEPTINQLYERLSNHPIFRSLKIAIDLQAKSVTIGVAVDHEITRGSRSTGHFGSPKISKRSTIQHCSS
jgi:hypothetical protein